MSYKGNNILGDKKYKKRFKKITNINPDLEKYLNDLNRQFLHAKTLGFNHPRNNRWLEFSSKLLAFSKYNDRQVWKYRK